MEAIKLATTLTTILAPALPFLLTANSSDQSRPGEIPESALAADRSLWQKILPKTSQRPDLLEAAHTLARNSKSSDAKAAFHQEMQKLLAADVPLFEDLKKEVIHHFVFHHFDPVVPHWATAHDARVASV